VLSLIGVLVIGGIAVGALLVVIILAIRD